MDGEVDAFLILVLSVAVAPTAGVWVLAIGAARYAFLAAGWPLAWMRAPLPRRDWRKTVTAVQGIVLTIAAADVLPRDPDAPRPRRRARSCWPSRSAATSRGSGAAAASALATSRSRRREPGSDGGPARGRSGAGACVRASPLSCGARRRGWRCVAPSKPSRLTPGRVRQAPARGPRDRRAGPRPAARPGSAVLALGGRAGARRPARREAARLRLLHGVRPPVQPDRGLGLRLDRRRDAARIDRPHARRSRRRRRRRGGGRRPCPADAGAASPDPGRGAQPPPRRPGPSRRSASPGSCCWVFGAQLVPGVPIASTSAAGSGRARGSARSRPACTITRASPPRSATTATGSTPGNRLLTALRGKDVLLVFVESYGQVRGAGLVHRARVSTPSSARARRS